MGSEQTSQLKSGQASGQLPIEKETGKMNTAQLLIKCFEEEGVKVIFGIPGEENLDIINAINESSIEFIVTRHEQGAAFMADIYGRLTGNAGVCMATLGPGATNLVTGVADANLDGVPLIALTGQVGTDRMHITSHQYLDLVKMFEPITKRSKQIVRPDTTSEIARIAFKYAESEKPGAVHIDLPNNIAKMEVNEKPLQRQIPQKSLANFKNIEKAAVAVSRAKHPVVLAGSGAVRAGAGEALTEFARQLKIPVVNTMMAKGIISCESEYSLWTVGIPQKDYIDKVFEMADLVIGVGYDLVEYTPSKWNMNDRIEIVHIATQAADINKHYQPKVEVIGDIKDSLLQILRRSFREEEPVKEFEIRDEIRKEHESYRKDNSFPMKPQKILIDVRSVMDEEDILISDVGAHKMWIARHYNCYRPNTCIISNGFASMGIAIPGAVAAKIVHPDKKVIAVTGDGGFMMNCQELETAVRIGTPFVTLILNDSSYGLIKWKQLEQFGRHTYVDFTNPDFVKLAESMYCKGYKIKKAEDLLPVLEDAFRQKVPSVIDCRVDYDENIKLTEHLTELWRSNKK